MTATAEDRAKAVWLECFDGRRSASRSTQTPLDLIAQAITQAEMDALRAAEREVYLLFCANSETASQDYLDPLTHAGERIRTLKPKD